MKQFIVQINPYLELINSILLTSKYNKITIPYIGYGLMTDERNEYTLAIKSFLDKYSDHQVYQYVNSMIPNGFTFSRPVEIALSLGNSRDFTKQFTPSDLCIKYCGGITKINKLISLLKEFARESKYFDFFKTAKTYYNPYIDKANKVIQAYPFINLLENEYGKEQNSYNYVISSLMLGNYGICFTNPSTLKTDMFSVFTTDNFSLSPAVLLHEYSHPFINPLTDKYFNIAKKYQNAYEILKPYKLPDFQSGYGDWKECINEHLVRAMVIHLLKKCQLREMSNQFLTYELNNGYKYIPYILEKYDNYDKNRDVYNDFDQFYPDLLSVFESTI